MSSLTLQDLLDFDAAPWHTTAEAWKRLARDIDDTTDQLISGTRNLSTAWPRGDGSTEALAKAARLRAEVDNSHQPAKSMADAFDQHAYAMKSLQSQADGIIASAKQAGYTVNTATGAVTAPDNPIGTVDKSGTLSSDLHSVVEYAKAQDDATATTIRNNLPSAGTGFGSTPPGTIKRAQDLINTLKDPAHDPTNAELEELRNLIQLYGKDREFAYTLLNSLGPEGLLQLNGTFATYQLDRPGDDTGAFLFDRYQADLVKDLQNGLGQMLSTATTRTGHPSGPRGEEYTPGEYELSNQWISDLTAAGRSQMTIGNPLNQFRSTDVYGYQLLGPMLHSGDYDAKFLSTVGGDMIDFEMQTGENSDMWTASRKDDIRLDWTQGHDDNTTPAGYDPVNTLMEALSRNGEGTRDLLTGTVDYAPDQPDDGRGRLPRLDYLLTDRNWETTRDVPGGMAWTVEAMKNQDGYQNDALDKFGEALEHATTDQPGPDSRRLVESIIFELNVDEEARGYENGEKPGNGKTEDFAAKDLIKPQLRDSMANITAAYIRDVNLNITEGNAAVPGEDVVVDRNHLVRFLAEIGKDETAHNTVATAEAVYTAGSYDDILSGRRNPTDDMNGHLRSMDVVSHDYGSVVGALDFGATQVHHRTSEQIDADFNSDVEKTYKVVGFLSDQIVGKATERIPVPLVGDLAGEYVGDVVSQLEEQAKVDNRYQATNEVATALGAGRNTAVALTEQALYNSGTLKLPENLTVDGAPKPVSEWTSDDYRLWQRYKADIGQSTVGSAATAAGGSYQEGYEWANDLFKPQKEKNAD
ncbi:DUF6571 family protein [Actinoplanes sp. NBRC 101535]|uniref:DUF6571 family protein n=1 Tax=Actinoplanes sp. NBRC 101535 TaxID=3032196 RepID=UPI0024A54CDA|nr:DUF6571 family protein [Actinoplanes sp. NBRC 101535]GLY00650.1 hypothetical protein Acsp01_10290 [Actinoplanes sp. NBRC 101535]